MTNPAIVGAGMPKPMKNESTTQPRHRTRGNKTDCAVRNERLNTTVRPAGEFNGLEAP
jgi:hypothetical protein